MPSGGQVDSLNCRVVRPVSRRWAK
jgi:hypothetical protein